MYLKFRLAKRQHHSVPPPPAQGRPFPALVQPGHSTGQAGGRQRPQRWWPLVGSLLSPPSQQSAATGKVSKLHFDKIREPPDSHWPPRLQSNVCLEMCLPAQQGPTGSYILFLVPPRSLLLGWHRCPVPTSWNWTKLGGWKQSWLYLLRLAGVWFWQATLHYNSLK